MNNPFNTVIQILVSESSDLKFLAQLTGAPLGEFYRCADLRNVDLSGQDLTGLNFEKADLRGAELNDIKFDPGAFNGSIIDEKFASIVDPFDFFLDDIDEEYFSRMSIMYRFRPGIVDEILNEARISYSSFSERAETSTATLRRVRQGLAVANESVFGIVDVLRAILSQYSGSSLELFNSIGRAFQPMINVGFYNADGDWNNVSKIEIRRYLWMLNEINISRFGEDWRENGRRYSWTMKPSSLEWAYHYFVASENFVAVNDHFHEDDFLFKEGEKVVALRSETN